MTMLPRHATLAAVCLMLATILTPDAARAGERSKGVHAHNGSQVIAGGSFRSPINYKPQGVEGYVRAGAYDAAQTRTFTVPLARKRSLVLQAARRNKPYWRSVVSVETIGN